MLHYYIERPAAVGAANGPESKSLLDELHQYAGGGGNTQDPCAIWHAAFTRPGSMRACQSALGLAAPPIETMQHRMIRARQTLVARDIGIAGLEGGGVLIPLYGRSDAVAHLQPWRGWTQEVEPNFRAYVLGIDDYTDTPCQPPIVAVLEIAGSGTHRITGQRLDMVHAHPRLIDGKLTIDLRLNPRTWLGDLAFYESSPQGDCAVFFPSALVLATNAHAIDAIADAVAFEPGLEQIRVLDPGQRSETFAARLQDAILRRRLRRHPIVRVFRTQGGAA